MNSVEQGNNKEGGEIDARGGERQEGACDMLWAPALPIGMALGGGGGGREEELGKQIVQERV